MGKKSVWALCILACVLGLVYRWYSRVPQVASQPRGEVAAEPVKTHVPVPISVQLPVEPEALPGGESHRAKLNRELAKLSISPAVRAIMGLDGHAADRDARMNAMKQLTRQLKEDDISALRLFLDFRFDDQKDLPLLMFNALKNDALDVMLRQNARLDGLGGQLVQMFKDKNHDDVWRDYCVQYFRMYYNLKWPGAAPKTKDAERDAIEEAYWTAMEEVGKGTAGTALLNLETLSRAHSEFDRQKIGKKAMELAGDARCIESARITALRVCGMMGQAEALPAAREIAQTGETIPLRMAAIATIGDLGGKDDLELVQSLAEAREKRIKPVAEAALKKMKDRAG